MKLFNGRVSKPECGCVNVTSKRIEELENRELGFIQSLRELEAENKALREAILDWWNGAPDDADCDERLGQVAAAEAQRSRS